MNLLDLERDQLCFPKDSYRGGCESSSLSRSAHALTQRRLRRVGPSLPLHCPNFSSCYSTNPTWIRAQSTSWHIVVQRKGRCGYWNSSLHRICADRSRSQQKTMGQMSTWEDHCPLFSHREFPCSTIQLQGRSQEASRAHWSWCHQVCHALRYQERQK